LTNAAVYPICKEQIVNLALSFSFRMEILALTLLAWMVMYFFVNRLPVEAERRLDMGMALDRNTPFLPQFIPVYFSTYPFVLLPFFIVHDERQFYIMLASFAAISFCATLVHALVPSKIERVEQPNTGNPSGWLLGLYQKTCKPHGNFPSMHVGLSVPVIAATFLVGGPFVGSVTIIWTILIALSTLFTKQHYILDVLAGLLGGCVIFGLVLWIFSNIH
jgi:membrane-associated phospholipid phosphatase